jgi:hypothetical protein
VSLSERIKTLLLNFCEKIFSQNSIIPIQIFNGFLIFYNATWDTSVGFFTVMDEKDHTNSHFS